MNSKQLANLNRLKSVAQGVDVSGKADKTYVDERDAVILSEAKSYADSKIGNVDVDGQVDKSYVDAHDAETLNSAKSYTDSVVGSKANASDLTSHSGDTTVHITSAERTAWNNKSDSNHNHDGVYASKSHDHDGTYAPKEHVHDQYITEHQDISGKAEKTDLNAHTGNTTVHITSSERTKWNNKSDFSGNYNDLTNKPTIPTVPVQSVNGKTGAVVLSASDVGASPTGHTHDQYLTEHQDISGKANVSDLTSHTGNKSNPHGVTKAQIGLGNVENKSSATIRGELTKANVTDALGYTPATSEGGSTVTSGTATLSSSAWTLSGEVYSQTVNVSGVTATSIVIVSPIPGDSKTYGQCGIIAMSQGSGTLTFNADTIPSVDLTVNVVNLGEEQ